jgi:hypothetical protein
MRRKNESSKRTGPPRLELGMPGSKPGVLPITPRAKMFRDALYL